MTDPAPSRESSCCEPACCDGDAGSTAASIADASPDGGSPGDPEAVRRAVRDGYGRLARGEGPSCCGPDGAAAAAEFARAVGCDAVDLAALPEGANLGLSCDNPTALAGLRPGEVVLDLGAGAGFDVFVAAGRVGPGGRAIGVDMTPDMVEKARAHAADHRVRTGLDNVEFRRGEIENLPAANAAVDVVLSNCVINLSPHKERIWREIARVLRPGGRVAVTDIALKRPLPDDFVTSLSVRARKPEAAAR